MTAPRALVLRAPGTNRDDDAALALQLAGAVAECIPLGRVLAEPALVRSAQLLVIPGGFSFADALGAGRLFALELVRRLGDELRDFVAAGKPVLGICNGFQVLIRTGLLPGNGQTVALGNNLDAAGRDRGFVCEWVTLQPVSKHCIWTAALGNRIECPIAHGEGRFVADAATLEHLQHNDQVAFRYVSANPNGSAADIAGISDASGVVLGLMPHPENHVVARQHPRHRRAEGSGLAARLFAAGVDHAAAL